MSHEYGAQRPEPTKGDRDKPKRMSPKFKIMNDMMDGGFKRLGLTPPERLVWLTIWPFIDAKTCQARVSYDRVARACGYSRRHVIALTARAKDKGAIDFDAVRNRANQYTLKPP